MSATIRPDLALMSWQFEQMLEDFAPYITGVRANAFRSSAPGNGHDRGGQPSGAETLRPHRVDGLSTTSAEIDR